MARLFGLAVLCLAGCESILGLRELRFEDMEAGSDAETYDNRENDSALGPDVGDAGHEADAGYEADACYEAGDAASEVESSGGP